MELEYARIIRWLSEKDCGFIRINSGDELHIHDHQRRMLVRGMFCYPPRNRSRPIPREGQTVVFTREVKEGKDLVTKWAIIGVDVLELN